MRCPLCRLRGRPDCGDALAVYAVFIGLAGGAICAVGLVLAALEILSWTR